MGSVHAVLCLEDGRALDAALDEITFEYRYDLANSRWVDVSGPIGLAVEGDTDADPDQEDADDVGS